jgi:hypothetical protein
MHVMRPQMDKAHSSRCLDSTKRKIIYVCFGRLTDKMAQDWYVDCLIENGMTVEYWDIVALVRKEHSERGALYPGYLHVFRSIGEVEKALQHPENKDAFYVMLITYVAQFMQIFRLLSKYDCRMLYFAWGAMPQDPAYKWRKIFAWLSSPYMCAKEIVNRSKALALRRLKLVKPFEITFVAGDALLAANSYSAKVVPINYFDYDHYVNVRDKGNARLVSGQYAVFLDINLPYHTDLEFCGYSKIDPVDYYHSLNRFFGLLEQQYGIRVVIAAHPRADYDSTAFEGRQIFRLVTAELVRDAEFVLSHTSTAISYAVLNAKPLVFIYTDAMATAYQQTFIREMQGYADYLDAPIYNIDAARDAHQVFPKPVNQERYERYKYDYLTSRQSEDTPTHEIVLREIQSYSIVACASH